VNLGPYASFILTAYGAAIAIVCALIVWVALDRRHLNRRLEQAEAQGIMRRSQRMNGQEP
jgi:heme exporter protein D